MISTDSKEQDACPALFVWRLLSGDGTQEIMVKVSVSCVIIKKVHLKEDEIMVGAVVLAGGQGKRMNAGMNKQYLLIDGRSVLSYAIESMACGADEIIIVAANGEEAAAETAIKESGVDRTRCKIVIGGKERQDSVRHAMEAMPDSWEKVMIHDGARPFVPKEVVNRLLEAVQPGIGAIPGLPVTDTVKRVDEEGFILATPPRHMLRAAQTPQCFWAEEIKALHLAVEKENLVFTDDAALYEYGGKRVRMVDGAIMTKKLTIQDDLMWVEQMKKVWEDQK